MTSSPQGSDADILVVKGNVQGNPGAETEDEAQDEPSDNEMRA
jgi:hypothetical protein